MTESANEGAPLVQGVTQLSLIQPTSETVNQGWNFGNQGKKNADGTLDAMAKMQDDSTFQSGKHRLRGMVVEVLRHSHVFQEFQTWPLRKTSEAMPPNLFVLNLLFTLGEDGLWFNDRMMAPIMKRSVIFSHHD